MKSWRQSTKMQGYHQQQQVATAWQWHIFAATASRKQHVGHKNNIISVFATTLESFYVRSWLKLLCLLCYQSPVFNKILLTKRYMMLKIFKPSCFCFDNWVLLFKHQRLKRRIKQLHILRTQVFREICRHTSKMSRCAEFRFIRWNCQIGGYTLQNKCFIEQFSSSSSPKE